MEAVGSDVGEIGLLVGADVGLPVGAVMVVGLVLVVGLTDVDGAAEAEASS